MYSPRGQRYGGAVEGPYGPGENRNNGVRNAVPGPKGAIVLDGYREEIMDGFEGMKPISNPMNAGRTQSSPLLDMNDSMQVHLLVEIALWDSREFEILSQEEVDDVKRQCQSLTQRIEQTRQTLAIQSKLRDAANSMAKLNRPEPQRNLGFQRNPGNNTQSRDSDIERATYDRKCEDLAIDLWSLEKQFMEPQQRLLKHTAGILQMTHKGPKGKGLRQPKSANGLPGSPESMYTYHNARNSLDAWNEDLFDERSMYRPADFENELVGILDLTQDSAGPTSEQSAEQMHIIASTEQRLKELNSALREIITKVNPQREVSHSQAPLSKFNAQGKLTTSGDTLQSNLDDLEQSIVTLDREHTATTSGVKDRSAAMENTLHELNRGVRHLLLPNHASLDEPPELSGHGMRDQLYYFQDLMSILQAELAAVAPGSKTGGPSESHEQMQAVLEGLWQIILSGEEDMRQRKMKRRSEKARNGVPNDSDDSDDHSDDPNEPFTISAFSTKVQWLYSQATRLKDQKKVLQRQIKQQRELNNKSDATKDAEIVKRTQDLESTKGMLTQAERNVDAVQGQLNIVMAELNKSRQQQNLSDAEIARKSGDESASLLAAQHALAQANDAIGALEVQLDDLRDDHNIGNAEIQSRLAESEDRMASLQTELEAAVVSKAAAEALVQAKEKDLEAKENEMESMNMDLANLKTEVTIARAELDGAYGSRAQRAAEVASNPAIQREIDDLNRKNMSLASEIMALRAAASSAGQGSKEQDAKVADLKKELEDTIEEFEQITKASIEWEKEREGLESVIDRIRDEKEGLESALADERVRWLGMRSPGLDGGALAPGTTSTTVLKNEFKKMMRDTRQENTKALRAEQAERRRLEDELRALKKAAGLGRSNLGQSMLEGS